MLISTTLQKLYLHSQHQFIRSLSLKESKNFKRSIKVSCNSIIHHNELTLWRCDLQSFIGQKLIMNDRLVKVTVIEYDWAWCISFSKSYIIIEMQLKSWITSKIAFHLNAAVNTGVDDISWTVEQNVDLFVNIDKYLILIVLADRNTRSWWIYRIWIENWKIA